VWMWEINQPLLHLDETGNVILEQRVPTTPKGIQQVFGKISRCRSHWKADAFALAKPAVDAVGHEVIVARMRRNVQLITESTRKDDRLDARTLHGYRESIPNC